MTEKMASNVMNILGNAKELIIMYAFYLTTSHELDVQLLDAFFHTLG